TAVSIPRFADAGATDTRPDRSIRHADRRALPRGDLRGADRDRALLRIHQAASGRRLLIDRLEGRAARGLIGRSFPAPPRTIEVPRHACNIPGLLRRLRMHSRRLADRPPGVPRDLPVDAAG